MSCFPDGKRSWLPPEDGRLTETLVTSRVPRRGRRDKPAPNPPEANLPQTPARALPAGTHARVARAARRPEVHRQPRPMAYGPDGAPLPGPEVGEGGREEGGRGLRGEEVSRQAQPHRTGHPE